jgi:hypothetical protein
MTASGADPTDCPQNGGKSRSTEHRSGRHPSVRRRLGEGEKQAGFVPAVAGIGRGPSVSSGDAQELCRRRMAQATVSDR